MSVRPRDRVALGVVLLLALVGASYLLVLQPERQKVSTLAAAIADQRRTLVEAQSKYGKGRAAEASLKAGAMEWAALRRAVPKTSDIPALLRTLEGSADAAHVKMQGIQLGGSAAAAAGAPTSTTSGAISVPLQLTFAGSYAALNNLVRRFDDLVVVSGRTVHATGPLLSIGDVSLSGPPNLTAQLTATIYQLDAASTAATP